MGETKKRIFFRKGERTDVYALLISQCEQACGSADLLVKFMETLDPDTAVRIGQTEKAADRERKKLIEYVEDTFITPVSRHYLFNLSRVIDDLSDEILDLKDFIEFFEYKPTEKNIEMATLCRDSVYLMTEAVRLWNSSDESVFWDNVTRAKKNENRVKRLFWENLKEIEQSDQLQQVITSREFCRDLNSLANKIGKVCDRLSDLKIKSIK